MKTELNKLSENSEGKLALASENLDANINSVSDTLHTKLNSIIQNLTSDMTKENDEIRKGFSNQLKTEIQSVTNEAEVVKNTTDMELANLVRSVECVCVCEGINESINAHKSQTDANVNSLRSEINQNKEDVNNKVGEISAEIRPVASSLEQYSNKIQTDTEVYKLEIQIFKIQVKNISKRLNSNKAHHATSQVRPSSQASATARLTDVGQPCSQVSSTVSESGSHISPSINDVNVCNVSACNDIHNTNNTGISCSGDVNAPSETCVNASQYSKLSLPKPLKIIPHIL
jgi:hypothetical protein